MKEIHIKRTDFLNEQTQGILKVIDNGETIFECKTLELPWLDNDSNISCIPTGKYFISKYSSKRFPHTLHIHDVPNRAAILIHAGNFFTNTHGCILVGSNFKDIDGDGLKDITSSRKTLRSLYLACEGTSQIIIQ